MPTLQFKGRNVIWNHHLSVPYHSLDEVKDLHVNRKKDCKNLLIEGDNLVALKALLPTHAGKVSCIYIDPPYNTGNEGWIYNDKVNSPLISDWLGKVVNKDDLTKHDKWLCMMVPRLKLLSELLSDTGIICISIDDNEFNGLINICDEIFGGANRFGIVIVENNPRGRRLGTEFAVEHEYLVIYTKDISKFEAGRVPMSEDQLAEYSKIDENGKRFRLLGLRKRGALSKREDRPNLHYPLYVDPLTEMIHLNGKKGLVKVIPHLSDGSEGVWRWGKTKVRESGNLLKAVIVTRKESGEKEWDVFQIDYLEDDAGEVTGRLFPSIWQGSEFNNETGRDQIKELFGVTVFEYPKPVDLIRHSIILANDVNGTILDSFSGSGTTGQAVLEQNAADGGKRNFILVQMTEATSDQPKKNICKDIARERLKRAIEKFGFDAGFTYLRQGIPLDAESMLSEKLPTYRQFAKYVYYLCTGEHLGDEKKIREKNYYVGHRGNFAVHLVYAQDFEGLTRLALNLDLAEKFRKMHPNKRLVVYAPACFLSEEDLEELQIDFVGIPYNLFQRDK